MTYLAGLTLMLSLIVAIGAQNVFVLRQGIRREHVGIVVAICALSDAALVAVGVSGAGAIITSLPWLVTAATSAGAAFLFIYAALAARRAFTVGAETLTVTETPTETPHDSPVTASVGDAAVSVGDGSANVGDTSVSIGDGSANVGDAFASHRHPTPTVTPAVETTGPSASAMATGSATATASGTATAAAASAGAVALSCLALTWLNPHVYLDTVFLIGTVAASHGDARWLFALGAMTGSVLWFIALGYGARLLGRVLARPMAWRVLDGIIAVLMVAMGVLLLLR